MEKAVLLGAGAVALGAGAYVMSKNDQIDRPPFQYYDKFPGYFQVFFGLIDPFEAIIDIDQQNPLDGTQYFPIISQFHDRLYAISEDKSLESMTSNIYAFELEDRVLTDVLEMYVDEIPLRDIVSPYLWINWPEQYLSFSFAAVVGKVLLFDFSHTVSKLWLEYEKSRLRNTDKLAQALDHVLKCLLINQFMFKSPVISPTSDVEEYQNLTEAALLYALGVSMKDPYDLTVLSENIGKIVDLAIDKIKKRGDDWTVEGLEDYQPQFTDHNWQAQMHAYEDDYEPTADYTNVTFGAPEQQISDQVEEAQEMIDQFAYQIDSGELDGEVVVVDQDLLTVAWIEEIQREQEEEDEEIPLDDVTPDDDRELDEWGYEDHDI